MSWRTHSLVLSLVCTSMAFADSSSKASPKDECMPDRKPMRVTARHIESRGVGYKTGYTTVEGFFGYNMADMTMLPFLDLRGHVFNDGKLAANAGLGFRSLLGCRIYGINAYYDYRNTRKSHYNQVSVGLETIGVRWDVRLNGYLPVGGKMSHPYHAKFYDFSGNSMLITRKYEYAMKGADAEFGVHFCKSRNFEFYAAAGPYYFNGPIGDHLWGGKARINGKWKDLIVAEISNSYDNIFHNNFQGQLSFNYPFGPRPVVKKKASHCYDNCKFVNSMSDRLIQPVARDEIVVVHSDRKKSVAIDPATGKPFNFLFVDNTSHSAGTYESPYSSLITAETNSNPSDIIYVFPGDGTTTNMDVGIRLQNNQMLLGSGTAQTIQTTAGTITIPALTSTTPIIFNIGGDTVSLANNNTVSGMFIQHGGGGLGNGISQQTAGVNVAIFNNTIALSTPEGSTTTGINLTDVTGNVQIANNFFNQGQLNSGTSISIDSTSLQNANYSITGNQGANDIAVNISLTDCSNYNFNIADNSFNSSTQILDLTFDNPTESTAAIGNLISINNNVLNCGDSAAFSMTFSDFANSTVAINNNIITAYEDDGLDFAFNGNSQTILSMNGNTITSDDSALLLEAANASTVSASIKNNTINGNFEDTVEISTNSTGSVTATIINNNFFNDFGRSDDSCLLLLLNDGTNSATISDNTFSTGYNGVEITVNGGTNSATISSNSFSNQSNDGVKVTNTTGTTTVEIDSNTFFTSINQAVEATNASSLCLTLINNTATPIQQGNGNGAYLLTNTSGTFTLDAQGNTGLITESGTTPGTCN